MNGKSALINAIINGTKYQLGTIKSSTSETGIIKLVRTEST